MRDYLPAPVGGGKEGTKAVRDDFETVEEAMELNREPREPKGRKHRVFKL